MVTGPSLETSKPSVLCPPPSSPSAASDGQCPCCVAAGERRELTVVDGHSVDRDACSTNCDSTSRRVLDDDVLEGAGVINTEEWRWLGHAAARAETILKPIRSSLGEKETHISHVPSTGHRYL
jgi:hypothetical protein